MDAATIPYLRHLAPRTSMDWQPLHSATLGFLQRADQVLLIYKKRGLGQGKINGPGGKCEPGESPVACVLRELYEEIGVRAHTPQPRGVLRFYFLDGYALEVHIFVLHHWIGIPMPSAEAAPFWCAQEAIPVARMWEDNQYWLSRVLQGAQVQGHSIFDGDRMQAGEFRFSPCVV